MKKLILILSLTLLSFTSSAEELIGFKAQSGKVTIRVPKGFGPMPSEMIESKYPDSRGPTEVLSDKTGGVTLAFNHTKNAMSPIQVKAARPSMSKMFRNLTVVFY